MSHVNRPTRNSTLGARRERGLAAGVLRGRRERAAAGGVLRAGRERPVGVRAGRKWLAPLLALAALAAAPSAHAAVFAPSSPWNTPLAANAAVDPNSAAMVAKLNGWVAQDKAKGAAPYVNTTSYSTPVYVATPGTPLTDVILDYQNLPLNAALQGVPIPSGAQAAAGTDQHMVVEDPAKDEMWEFWRMRQRLPVPGAPLALTAATGGSVTAGTHTYAVTALSSQGETTASPAKSIALSAPGSVSVSWRGLVGATGYRVYRDGGLIGTANVATTAYGTTVKLTDTGAAAGAAAPAANTADTPGQWHAAWGGRILNVSQDVGYFRDLRDSSNAIVEDHSWGASASSLPMIGGLPLLSELASGHIDHAIELMIPDSKAATWTFPAQRTDGSDTSAGAIPEGTRFRLDPTLDLSSIPNMPPFTRMIAVAAQKYGLIVNDITHTDVGIRAEDPSPLIRQGQANPYPAYFTSPQTGKPLAAYQVLASFPWDRLQAVSPTG